MSVSTAILKVAVHLLAAISVSSSVTFGHLLAFLSLLYRMEAVKRSEDRVHASLAPIASKYGITEADERYDGGVDVFAYIAQSLGRKGFKNILH